MTASRRLALEAKPQDLRQKMLIDSTGKAMMLSDMINRPNFGLALDVGHSFAAGENPAEACAIIDKRKKLVQVHLNDNYKNADPDMFFGSVNFWENLEFLYYLLQTDFKGWCSIDIISGREDRKAAFKTCVKLTTKYFEWAQKLVAKKDVIDSNMVGYNFSSNIELLMELLFK